MANGLDPQSWGGKAVQCAKCWQHAQKSHYLLSPSCRAVLSVWVGWMLSPMAHLMMRTWASENALKRLVAVQKLLELFSVSLQIKGFHPSLSHLACDNLFI